MPAFDFKAARSSGTYTDANGVRWFIHASPSDLLAGEWTADTEPSSRYGVVTIWGPTNTLKARLDEYAAGYAVVPPATSSGGGGWLLLLAAVVLLDEDKRR
jgi:hypothetical protein